VDLSEASPEPMSRSVERMAALALAAAGTAVAWVAFSRLSFPVRVGTESIAKTAPVVYQVSAFPAFCTFVALFAVDVLRKRDRRTWAARAALLAATSALALVRLHGDVPVSGHALFLFAALAYELIVPVDAEAPLVVAMIIPGLLVTGWYKLAVWGDAGWFAASAVAGCALGALLGRAARGTRVTGG
jgi:hypothetical protein